ncbi:hypothetical protein GGR92_005210 [Spirosoma lacussanchae]|uniref:hypothetical protein n=1 Tax=Spirosoma lacussanchae TaxID=1884249 RepID=UPI001109EA38|nr:hypothetical protein [Spirosoma lacussanchae]
MKLFVAELWHFAAVFVVLLFFVAFYIRWMQSYRISHGHFIIGMGAVGSTFVALLVAMFAFSYLVVFLIGCLLGAGIWLIYNDWYFYRFPIGTEVLAPVDVHRATLGADTRLGRYLRRRQESQPAIFNPRVWLIGACLLVVSLFSFGFYRVVTAIAVGEKRAVAAQKAATGEVKKEVVKVRSELTQTVQEVADSLKAGQQAIVESTQTVNRETARLAATVARETKTATSRMERKLDRTNANVERARKSAIIIPAPVRSSPPINLLSPDRVKPVPVEVPQRRNRHKVGYAEWDPCDCDSLLARNPYLYQ